MFWAVDASSDLVALTDLDSVCSWGRPGDTSVQVLVDPYQFDPSPLQK